VTILLKKTDSGLQPDWSPIETYVPREHGFIIVANEHRKWIRFGRLYPGLNRWYYSGTTEQAQYSEGHDDKDKPTHWAPMFKAPWD
jgi:hypothetical protein